MIIQKYNARTNSEFNLQAELFIKLRNRLKLLDVDVFGEVRLMSKEKTGGHFSNKKNRIVGATRKQKGRLDIGIFQNGRILCAIEVKNKRIGGWLKQKRKYINLGVPEVFLCSTREQINDTIEIVKKFIL